MSVTSKTIELVIGAKDKATTVLGKIGSGLSTLYNGAKVAALATAAAAAAATTAIAAVVSKTLDYGDSLAKNADKLGLTTEALAGMRHAAELSGVGVQGLDKSVKVMNKNLSDAAAGTGEARVAFDGLNLSARQLSEAGPEKAFALIVEKLNGVENASDRVNFAMKIFGKSGADVLNMTAEGLRAAKQEAEDFGLALSRADAKKMEDVNDSITRIKSAFGGAGTALTVALLDPLKGLAARLVEMAKSGELAEWGTKIGEIAGRAIDWFTEMVLGVGKLQAVWDIAAGGFGAFIDMFATGMNQAAAFVLEGFGQIAGAIDTLTFGAIPGLDGIEDDFKTLAYGARIAAEETTKSWQANSDKVTAAWDVLSAKGKETKFEAVAEGLQKTADAAGDTVEPVKAVGDQLEKTAEQAAKAQKSTQDYQLAMAKIVSGERVKLTEIGVKFKTEQLKADAAKVKAIMANIGTSISSTSSLLGSLFGNLKETTNFSDRWALQDQIKDTNKANQRALDDAHNAAEQLLKMNEARLERMASGDALIKISGDGLTPALEMVLFEIVELVQLRVSEEADPTLLGS